MRRARPPARWLKSRLSGEGTRGRRGRGGTAIGGGMRSPTEGRKLLIRIQIEKMSDR